MHQEAAVSSIGIGWTHDSWTGRARDSAAFLHAWAYFRCHAGPPKVVSSLSSFPQQMPPIVSRTKISLGGREQMVTVWLIKQVAVYDLETSTSESTDEGEIVSLSRQYLSRLIDRVSLWRCAARNVRGWFMLA